MPTGIECLNLLILKIFLKLDTLTGNKNSDFFVPKLIIYQIIRITSLKWLRCEMSYEGTEIIKAGDGSLCWKLRSNS